MLLVADNGSAYTGSLVEYLDRMGAGYARLRPDEYAGCDVSKFGSYVLSGRRRNDPGMNLANSRIIRHAVSAGKPLLGICYGAEMLALTLGGAIRRMGEAHAGAGQVDILEPNPLCSGSISVFESHRFEISRLGPSLERIGSSEACKNEMIRLGGSGIFGVQFHPEMTDDGREIIRRFAAL